MGLQKHFGGFLGVPLNSVCLSVCLRVLLEVRGLGFGSFRNWGGTLFWGPYDKDPNFRKPPFRVTGFRVEGLAYSV